MSFILLALFLAGCGNVEVPQTTNVKVLGLGDSISAGYAPSESDMYSFYNEYETGKVQINKKCFTYVVGENISNDYIKATSTSHAQSGDKTEDLISKLNNEKVLNDLKNADLVTLCIGANNILSVGLNNLTAYLNGSITDEEISSLLNTGVENFKNDYTNTIIPILTRGKAKIFVMTIYDPYKYFDFNDAEVDGSFVSIVNTMGERFNNYKALLISYLNQINDYIRSEKFQNVYVVDVNSAFESLNKTDYAKYINVNSQKIWIRTIVDLMSLSSNIYVDPHPTIEGQKYIAELYTNKILDVSKCEVANNLK